MAEELSSLNEQRITFSLYVFIFGWGDQAFMISRIGGLEQQRVFLFETHAMREIPKEFVVVD